MNALKFSNIPQTTVRTASRWISAVVLQVLRLFRKKRRSGPSGESPGLAFAGVPVPVGPRGPHHLQAAKEFPPSDRSHSYPKD
jgi:hypothetical protein